MKIKLKRVRSLFRKRHLFMIMRAFVLLLCTTVFSLTPENSFSQEKVNIDQDKLVSVDQVFKIIKQQTDYDFIYKKKLFKNAPKVQLTKGEILVTKLLEKSLSSSNVSYELSNSNAIIIIEKKINDGVTVDDKQERHEVVGIITDESDLPLPGANILEKGTLNGTQTDFDGKFALTVSDENAVLIVSYLGFTNQEIPLNGQTSISVKLIESAATLDEIVVIGYGSVKKENLTGGKLSALTTSATGLQTGGWPMYGKNAKHTSNVNAITLSTSKELINGLTVYPNPVDNGEFYISTTLNSDKLVQIFDITGRKIYAKKIRVNEKIKTSNLKTGVYFVNVFENAKQATVKLLVQ